MKVLWFTNTPSNYLEESRGYNGGGWISSLENEISSRVELAVAFVMNDQEGKTTRDGVVYYPIPNPYNRGRADRVKKFLFGNAMERSWLLSCYVNVIKEFHPDIIEVFGSEHLYGLVSMYTPVPVVLHVQGILGEYQKAFLPPDMRMCDYMMSDGTLEGYFAKKYYVTDFRRRAAIEKKILSSIGYFFGRTEWDKKMVTAANPSARYFHVDEVLRAPFYENARCWKPCGAPILVTTISEPPYKGMDVILRTAEILYEKLGACFRWIVYGNVNVEFFENFTGIDCDDVGVAPKGVGDADDLIRSMSDCAVYVHPSYADNSPNSVCEAQMLGVPVVASNVGGIPSLVDDGVTGLLAEVGSPEDFADKILRLISDREMALSMGLAAANVASVRHDKERIVTTMIETYGSLIGK